MARGRPLRCRRTEQLPASPLWVPRDWEGLGAAAQPLGHAAKVRHGRRETPRQGVTEGDYSQLASRLFWELPERCPFSLAAKNGTREGKKKSLLAKLCSRAGEKRIRGAPSPAFRMRRNPNADARHDPCCHTPHGPPLPKHPSPPARDTGMAEQAAAQRQPHRSCQGSARGDPREGTKPLLLRASAPELHRERRIKSSVRGEAAVGVAKDQEQESVRNGDLAETGTWLKRGPGEEGWEAGPGSGSRSPAAAGALGEKQGLLGRCSSDRSPAAVYVSFPRWLFPSSPLMPRWAEPCSRPGVGEAVG